MNSETSRTEVTQDQMDLVFNFLNALFNNNVQEYWDMISKIDQARVYGMYRAALETNSAHENLTFGEYVENEFMSHQRKIYKRVEKNPGLATHIRYTDEGEPQIYVLENVVEMRIVEEPTEERVFPVTLTVDASIKNDIALNEWKVRLYIDQEYKYV